MLAFERSEAFVTAVSRIDVNYNQPIGADAQVGLRREIAEPVLDHAALDGGGQQAVRGELAVRVLRGILAAWLAATFATAGAPQSAVVINRPIHREDRVTKSRKGHRSEQDGRLGAIGLHDHITPSQKGGSSSGPPAARIREDGPAAKTFSGEIDDARVKSMMADGAPGGHGAPHFSRIVLSDSCSAAFTTSQRCQATGSISLTISRSTQSRRSFGSIASSSQHRSPKLERNHL